MATQAERNYRDLIQKTPYDTLFGGMAGPTPSPTSVPSPSNPYAVATPVGDPRRPKGGTPLEVNILLETELRRSAAHAAVFSKSDVAGVARNMAAIRDLYPHMDAHVTASLAMSGYSADDDITKYMAASTMVKGSDPLWKSTADNVSKIPSEIGADPGTMALEKSRGNLVDKFAGILDSDPSTNTTPAPGGGGGGSVLGIDLPSSGVVADVTHAVGDVYQKTVEGLQGAPGTPAKAGSRAVFTGLETPFQSVVGTERNIAANINQKGVAAGITTDPFGPENRQSVASQTSGGIAIQNLAEGKPVDLGTGYMPGGQVEQQQAANSRNALSIAGHAWTPGRFAASLVTEPGTKPYDVLSGLGDAANVTYTDPVNILGGEISKLRSAHQVLTQTPLVADDATGLINGIRRTVHPQSAERWLTRSNAGTKVVERLALPKNDAKALTFLEIKKAVGGNASLAATLHDATTPGEVMDALRPALGIEVRNVPKLPYNVTRPLRDITDNSRILGSLPQGMMDTNNLDGSAVNFDDYLRNGKVSLADRNQLGYQFASAVNSQEQRSIVIRGAQKVEDSLVAHGSELGKAHGLTKLYKTYDDLRHYMIDAAGRDVTPFVNIDGAPMEMTSPAYYVDFMNRTIPLPNVRAIRHDTSFVNMHNALFTAGTTAAGAGAGFAATGTVQGAVAGGALGAGLGNTRTRDWAQIQGDRFNKYWKPLNVLRGALPVRVIADAQTRMAMTGHDNMFTHPIDFIAHMVAQRSAGGAGDIMGEGFKDAMETASRTGDYSAYADALSGWQRQYISNGAELSRRVSGFHVINMEQDPVHGATAWAERFGKLASDPVARKVAQSEGDLAAVKDYFTNGAGRGVLLKMIGGPEDVAYHLSDGAGGVSPNAVSTYIDNINRDLTTFTHSDPQLLRAVAEKKATIDGKEIDVFKMNSGGRLRINKRFKDHLQYRTDHLDSPAFMIGRIPTQQGERDIKPLNQAFDSLFEHILTQPVNKFAQSPVFIDNYYKRVGELAPMMLPEHRAAAAAVAEENGYKDIAKTIRKGVDTVSDRTLTPAEVDELAKSHAVGETKALLHDLNHRGQFFDMWRNIIPFGEAWKQMLTKWTKIIYQHPETLRKFQIGLNGAKDAGFFYTDPTTHQEMFNYPGSAWVTKETLGVPIPLSGAVQGLNMLGNGLPGAGPAIQLPVAYFLPDTPKYDMVRKIINPFGNQNVAPDNNPLFETVNALTPSWVEKAVKGLTGPESDRQFLNSTLAVAAYLRTTGEYGNSAKEQDRLIADAKSKAQGFYLIRSAASFFGPAAPQGDEKVLNKDGDLVMLGALKDEYRKTQAAGEAAGKPYDQIDQEFINKYGLTIFGDMQPFTRALVEALPTTHKQVQWERRNPDLMSKYPDAYGYFKPSDPKGAFDQVGYQRHLDNKQIQPLDPKTFTRFANDKIATHLYYQAKAMMPDKPTKEDRKWLSDIRQKLATQYQGFGSEIGKTGRASAQEQLAQITKAVKDPKLAKTPAAIGLSYALRARQQVIDAAKAQGLSTAPNAVTGLSGWQSAKKNLEDRQWLSGVYQRIEKAYPDASSALNIVFANDVRNIV